MTEDLKTMKELIDEHGLPLDVKDCASRPFRTFRCIAVDLAGVNALGWWNNGVWEDMQLGTARWRLAPKKKKYVEFMFLHRGFIMCSWEESEVKAKEHCENMGFKFIKTLREVEVDE